MSTPANHFYAYLARKLEEGGSETTIYLDRITTATGETIATSDFALFGRGILTINPDGDGESSFPEYCSFTAVDSANLAVTGVSRGLSAKGNSTVTANKRFHPSGTPAVLAFGTHNFQDIVDYIDNEISALSVGSNIVVTGLAATTISAGQVVYLNSDGKWALADADLTATIDNVILGIAQGSGTADNLITNGILLKGTDSNQSGLTAGNDIFISNTAGAISTSAGTLSKKIGRARTNTVIYFDPEHGVSPTAGQKAALAAGGNFGTPSTSNKFITEAYNASASGLPVVRTYLASGSPHTWTKPTGIKYVTVEVQGAGGQGPQSSSSAGGGGGAGAWAKKTIAAASLGATETVTVGAASVGSGNTSFGSHVTCGNGANATTTTGGAGGTATGGDVNINGQTGATGVEPTIDAVQARIGGRGGSSVLGIGGAGYLNTSATAAIAGDAGSGYGAGGGGGSPATDGNPTASGGAGVQGVVIVTEYYS